MNHPHSDQRNPMVPQRPLALSPYIHLVNATVSPLEPHSSAVIPARHREELPSVVDGEVLASIDTRPVPVIEPKRNLLWRAIDDPYWVLMTLIAAVGLSITATAMYGVIQITRSIAEWFHANGATLAVITTLIILLMLCGGATVAKCAGIHCRGCRG
ncbi:MAG: hypothetical protein ACRDRR_02140 [Pseudonocardiaceae bacterium]